MKKIRELAAQMCEGRMFEADGTASAKVPGQSMPRVLKGCQCGQAEQGRAS